MPPVTYPSSDPARAWASLHRLCQTYEGKLKEVSLKEVGHSCPLCQDPISPSWVPVSCCIKSVTKIVN